MKSELRHYIAGEVLFREGEDSVAVFIVESGRVVLLKATTTGDVPIETLNAGDLLGETDVLEKSPRNVTARADSEVTVRMVPGDEFLRAIETTPQTTLKILNRLARRQRVLNERLAQFCLATGGHTPSGSTLVAVGDYLVPSSPAHKARFFFRSSFLGRLFTSWGLLNSRPLADTSGTTPRLVLVTPLSTDPEYDQSAYLIDALAGLKDVSVKMSRTGLKQTDHDGTSLSPGADPARSRLIARQILAEEKGDLLVWGGENKEGRTLSVWFVTPAIPMVDRLAGFPPEQCLPLPADFDETWTPLIQACVLSALGNTPPDLFSLIDKAGQIGLSPPSSLSLGEQGQVRAAFGYCAATAAMRLGKLQGLDLAISAWQAAIASLSRDNDTDWTRLHSVLGIALQTRGERTRDEQTLRSATAVFRTALEGIRREDTPAEWGRIQARLGSALFQIDMLSGDEQALRDSLSAYKAAVTMISRTENPWQWADLLHGIAQTLQVWGDHTRNLEALRKAVDLCQSALEIRTPEQAPALFAATRNNMGSAQFLLAKHSGDAEYMRLAATSFREALAIHRESGAGGPLYKTIEKNLRRAEDLLSRHERRPVASLSWAKESAPETISSDTQAAALIATL